jgi:hypothetical protein
LDRVALILGLLLSLTGVTAASRGQDPVPHTLSGVMTIAGALAYRSSKRRRLGLCDNSIERRLVEVVALAAIVALLLLHNDVLARIYREPVPHQLNSASEQLRA